MWGQVKVTWLLTSWKTAVLGSSETHVWMSGFIYDFFPLTFLNFSHKTEQILCKFLQFITKTHVVAHSCMMQTQTFIQVCSTPIEQSWRPCWTGFRFPGVQRIVPSPLLALFLFSGLVIYFSHLHTESQSSSQDPLFLAIVSRVVNQVFLWLGASFTLAGFHCRRRLAKRPGNQQVHRQVCLDEDKAYWLTIAAPRPSKLAVWTVVLWGRLGTA